MRATMTAKWCACLLLLVLSAPALRAQAPAAAPETATQFYMKYLAAFSKATNVDDLLPFMAAETRKKVESQPAAERPKFFQLLKMMAGMNTGIKVTKEQRTSTGATLTAEAVGPDKKKVTGTITIVREGGAWKLGQESW